MGVITAKISMCMHHSLKMHLSCLSTKAPLYKMHQCVWWQWLRPDKVKYMILRHFYSKIDEGTRLSPPFFLPYKKVKRLVDKKHILS